MRTPGRYQLAAILIVALWAGNALATPPTTVGFIEDQPSLEPVPEIDGAWGWEAAGNPIAKYDKLMFDNIDIFLAPDSPYKGVDAAQMQVISKTMLAFFHKSLEPEYPIVSQAGPGVMRLSIALTNLKIKKKKRRLIGYTPIGLVVGGVRSLTDVLSNVSLENANVEAVATDAVTGERFMVRIATRPFAQAGVSESEMSWKTLEAAFRFYSENTRKMLDEAHGKQ